MYSNKDEFDYSDQFFIHRVKKLKDIFCMKCLSFNSLINEEPILESSSNRKLCWLIVHFGIKSFQLSKRWLEEPNNSNIDLDKTIRRESWNSSFPLFHPKAFRCCGSRLLNWNTRHTRHYVWSMDFNIHT